MKIVQHTLEMINSLTNLQIYYNNIFTEQLHSTTVHNMYNDNDDYMASASKHYT